MTLKQLTTKLKKFNKERGWDDGLVPEDVAKSIIIEAAELLEHYQWDASERNNNKNKQKDTEAIGEEIADVLIYTLRIAYLMNLDIEKIVLDKIQKNAVRYLPKN